MREHTCVQKLSPRARGHTAAGQTGCALVHWGQQLGLYPQILLTFKDVIVCRTCRPHTSALMACFSLWQPQRASTARLVIILIWSALLGNRSTYFPSFYTPVSLLSIFLYPFGIDLIVWHPRVAKDGEITRTLKLPRLPAYTLNVTLSSMPASGHKSDLCDRPKHWQLGSRAACRIWESNTLQLYTASIYFYIDVYKRLRTEVGLGHAMQLYVPVIYVLIYCSTFCLTQNYAII